MAGNIWEEEKGARQNGHGGQIMKIPNLSLAWSHEKPSLETKEFSKSITKTKVT